MKSKYSMFQEDMHKDRICERQDFLELTPVLYCSWELGYKRGKENSRGEKKVDKSC